MNITLHPWRYAADPFLPLAARASRYLLVLEDLPLESVAEVRAQALQHMELAPRHRYILPTASFQAAADLVGPNVWPALWVSSPLTQLDAMRVSTFLEIEAFCRVVLSPRRTAQVLAAARAVGAVVLEASRS